MPTTRDVVLANRQIFGCVPSHGEEYVCELCLGPVTSYAQCFACNQLFARNGVHPDLWGKVVPMTSVLNPSPWYGMLSTYKRGLVEHSPVLCSLAYEYLMVNAASIEELIGGEPAMFTIVPSKRGFAFQDQPFRRALGRVEYLAQRLRHTLVFDSSRPISRWAYSPDSFTQGPEKVDGARVLLLEDSWVTGATAMSAAGALLKFGASTVVVLPLARVVDQGFWQQDHPYRQAMGKPYRFDAWPR